MDRDFVTYILFLLGFGLLAGIPYWIFGTQEVGICGIISLSVGMAAVGIAGDNKNKNTFYGEMPFTYGLWWAFLGYAVIAVFKIGFKKEYYTGMSYDEIKGLARGALAYAIYPVLSFIIEGIIKNKNNSNT